MKAAMVLAVLFITAQGIAPNHHVLDRSVFGPPRQHPAINGVTTASRPSATKAHAVGNRSASIPKLRAYLQMPLDFEANLGQAPATYYFVAHGPSYALGVSPLGLSLALQNQANLNQDAPTGGRADLGLRLIGASNDASVSGLDPATSSSNYFIGDDPTAWQTHVPHFSRVKINNAYPGIDLVFYGNREQLEYDFVLSPGADPGLIRLQAEGTEGVRLDDQGNAILQTAAGDVELKRPKSYQEVAGQRWPVNSRFAIAKGNVLTVKADAYDRTQPLVIDPVLLYSAAIGGSNGNQGVGLTVDSAGYAYVTGNTCSADFPSTAGSMSTIHTDITAKNCHDGFVTKLDPTATTLIFSDYIGGAGGSTSGAHVAVDGTGNVYVAGGTGATNFPTVSNIGRTAPSSCGLSKSGYNCPQGFILKLSPDGSQLLFSSLLGGSQASGAYQVKINPVTGDLVVLGETNSSDFQPAPTTLETTFGGGSCSGAVPCFNSFLLGLNPATGALKYGTFLGGTGNNWSSGVAFDATGNIFVAGSTQPPMSSSLGAVTHTYGPSGGATVAGTSLFVAKLNLSGSTLTHGYLTLIQADADTGPSSIAVDGTGNAYFAGSTAAQHLGVTTGAYQATNNAKDTPNCLWGPVMTPFLPTACGTGLVGKLDATGALSFLTYLGGTGQDEVEAMGLDGSGNIWLTGVTSSLDFPVTAGNYTNSAGFATPYLSEMSNDGKTLTYSTIVAGALGQSTDLFVDTSNNVYIAGFGSAVTSTPGTYPANPMVFSPMFVQKWGPGVAPSISVSTTGLPFGGIPMGGVSAPQTATIQNQGAVPLQVSLQLGTGISGSNPNDFLISSNCNSPLAAGGSCTVTASFQPGLPAPDCVALPGCNASSRGAAILIDNNAPQGRKTIQLSGTAGVGASIAIAPNPIVFEAQSAGTSSAPLYVQVESEGDSNLLISNVALGGPNASEFQLSLAGAGGPVCTSPVGPGSFCSLSLIFSPASSATGTRTATLTFTDSAGDTPQVVQISGAVAGANTLNISPLTLQPSFPVAIGTSSTGVLTLQNPFTSSIQVTSLTIAGANQVDFAYTTSNCSGGSTITFPINVAAGTSCLVDMKFAPSAGASGARKATLTVGTNPANSSLPTIALQMDAVTNTDPGMGYFVVPNPMNFGGLLIGETSNNASALLSISNNAPIPCAGSASSCGAPLIISSVTPGLSDYTVQSNTGSGCMPFPATIAVGNGCTYSFVFKPTAAGTRNTTVTVQSNDPQGALQIPIYGSGLSLPLGGVLQTALNFGNSAIGVTSPPLTTTLQNNGLSNLTISSVTASANFAVSANTCTATPLAPAATCTISVTFTPPSAGPFLGKLSINDNGGFSVQQTVNLTGAGATGAQLRIVPQTLNFGDVTANSLSAAKTITLTSTGDSTLTFPTSSLRTSPDFIVQSTTCGATLAPGASCTVTIQFKPTTTAGLPEAGTLLVTDTAAGSPQPVYMQGTGLAGTAAATATTLTTSLTPSSLGQSITFTATVAGPTGNTHVPTGSVTFLDGTTTLGTGTLNGSAQATFTTSTLTQGSHTITASYGGDSNFAASTSNVLTQVVNGASKAASTTTLASSVNPSTNGQSVTFTASVAGPAGNATVPTGSVTFLDGTTTLGTGTLNGSAQATFTTSTLAQGSHTITVSYGGDSNFAGSISGALTQVVNGVSKAASTTTLASSPNPSTAGQSVTFTATAAGPSGNTTVPTGSVNFMDGSTLLGSGTLNSSAQATFTSSSLSTGAHSITAVYSGDANFSGSTSAALTQTVNAASGSFTVSANPTTITVTAGSSGTTTLTVTPSGGFNQQVTLACSGLPAASTCAFAPPTVTPSGSTAPTSIMTIATNVAGLVVPARPFRSRQIPGVVLAFILVGLGGLVRARRRLPRLLSALAFLCALGMLANACGGGGGSTSGTKTPKGSSTITVSATAGGVVQSTTVTLTVQ